ncbi:MAG TPA: VCBS repeat-containing protein, partial [Candidatus Bathyarchaeia archaeon]|nr:VCBS repeat-containing protein [Candidatus Bathyarchaeia archaeon]
WRYSGTGGYNLVWFLGDMGSAALPLQMTTPQAAALSAEAPSASALAASGRMASIEREKRTKAGAGEAGFDDVAGAMTDRGSRRSGLADPRKAFKGGRPTKDTPIALSNPRQATLMAATTLAGAEAKIAATGALGLAALPTVEDLNWEVKGTGDFNGDGHIDILWRYNGPGGFNLVWYMDGTEVTGLAALPTVEDLNWQIAGTGDFNNDGHVDILWRHAGYGYILVWYMNGTEVTGLAALPFVSDLTWEIVGTGDFNNDGRVDILWRYNGIGGYNLIWYLDGVDVNALGALPSVADLNWQIVGTGGFNLIWSMEDTSVIGLTALPSVEDLYWRIVSR